MALFTESPFKSAIVALMCLQACSPSGDFPAPAKQGSSADDGLLEPATELDLGSHRIFASRYPQQLSGPRASSETSPEWAVLSRTPGRRSFRTPPLDPRDDAGGESGAYQLDVALLWNHPASYAQQTDMMPTRSVVGLGFRKQSRGSANGSANVAEPGFVDAPPNTRWSLTEIEVERPQSYRWESFGPDLVFSEDRDADGAYLAYLVPAVTSPIRAKLVGESTQRSSLTLGVVAPESLDPEWDIIKVSDGGANDPSFALFPAKFPANEFAAGAAVVSDQTENGQGQKGCAKGPSALIAMTFFPLCIGTPKMAVDEDRTGQTEPTDPGAQSHPARQTGSVRQTSAEQDSRLRVNVTGGYVTVVGVPPTRGRQSSQKVRYEALESLLQPMHRHAKRQVLQPLQQRYLESHDGACGWLLDPSATILRYKPRNGATKGPGPTKTTVGRALGALPRAQQAASIDREVFRVDKREYGRGLPPLSQRLQQLAWETHAHLSTSDKTTGKKKPSRVPALSLAPLIAAMPDLEAASEPFADRIIASLLEILERHDRTPGAGNP